ncbi:hypothetical protein [Streptomyces sp. NPDC047841]|uniref:hypothetical protein n=1 Tax=Streptomyces sp. NPDC047841 TaxID=3154708 RepID=UPI003455BB30
MGGEQPLSRLDALRFARRVIEQQAVRQLGLIDRWIAEEERREAERRQGAEMRPAPADWLIQYGLNRGQRRRRPRRRLLGREEERPLPASHGQAGPRRSPERGAACVHCRPDTAFGIGD